MLCQGQTHTWYRWWSCQEPSAIFVTRFHQNQELHMVLSCLEPSLASPSRPQPWVLSSVEGTHPPGLVGHVTATWHPFTTGGPAYLSTLETT